MFYDTHAHLDYPEFAAELEAVLARAQAAGITKIISIGTDLESSARAVALAEKFPSVYAAVGWHPSYADAAPDDIRPALRELVRRPKVVAIGETGLDYHRLPSSQGGTAEDDARNKAKQAALFAQQMEVAAEAGLNCVIHQRASFADTVAAMRPFVGRLRGVFHCFSESRAALEEVLAMGCLVSFTGILTFKNGQNVRDALAAVSADRFMLETDCPYLAPVPHRGQRCEPAHVADTAACAAQVRGWTMERLGEETCRTADGFFRGLGQAA